MALGGGSFIAQNKSLPGAYMNFVNAARASAVLSDRGIATMPLVLDWGPEDEIFTVTSADFFKNSAAWFGYDYGHEKLKGLRELFLNIRSGLFYRLNAGGDRASNLFATALYGGERGNDLTVVIAAAEAGGFVVTTLLDGASVDRQTVSAASELQQNSFVRFHEEEPLEVTAGTPLVGGTDGGAVTAAAYQRYLDAVEPYSFHTMGCVATEETVKSLLVGFTRRMRDEGGVKFQTVLFRPQNADHEGIIAVENGLKGAPGESAAVYWVTGAEAGCAVNQSLTNALYAGTFDIDTAYTQAELEAGLKAGRLMLHRVGDEVRVLEDINSFVSVTDTKSADFGSNQTMRVLDQIGNDIAALFAAKYLGRVPNDEAGRISLWNDIVRHHQQLQTLRAIEDFASDDVSIEVGETKRAVVVTESVTPVSAMTQLYMTVVVE